MSRSGFRVNLMEYVDGAGTGRINPLSGSVPFNVSFMTSLLSAGSYVMRRAVPDFYEGFLKTTRNGFSFSARLWVTTAFAVVRVLSLLTR